MNAAIAQHLNILESAIVRVEEWSKVLFVVAKGIGARFVSKKVATMTELAQLEGSEKQVAWATDLRQKRIEELPALAELVNEYIVRTKNDGDWSTEDVALVVKAFHIIFERQTSAKWYIDERNRPTRDLINGLSVLKGSLKKSQILRLLFPSVDFSDPDAKQKASFAFNSAVDFFEMVCRRGGNV